MFRINNHTFEGITNTIAIFILHFNAGPLSYGVHNASCFKN